MHQNEFFIAEVYFNHQGVYNISKSFAYMDSPLKFKVFHRHLNQRSPTLLGMGLMNVNDVVLTKHLSMTERIAIVNKGIKVGELEVTVELGCDGIHFGQEFVGMFLFFFLFLLSIGSYRDYLKIFRFVKYIKMANI